MSASKIPRRIATLALAVAGTVLAPGAVRGQGSTVPHDSAAFAGATVVHLRNGMTAADVIGDGSTGGVLVAVKENYNAHGSHLVAIAVRPRAPGPDGTDWEIVPVEGDARGTGDVLGSEEGADCTLRDLRLLRQAPGRSLTLVVGQRALSHSYADPDSVRFTVYELRHNADGTVGHSTYYFTPVRVVRPARTYCDVNVAFGRELGLGRAGVAPSDASARAP